MIDYDLAEKIEATHYFKSSKHNDIIFCRFIGDMDSMQINQSRSIDHQENWTGQVWRDIDIANVKPIPPRPQVEYVYEDVDPSEVVACFNMGDCLVDTPDDKAPTLNLQKYIDNCVRGECQLYRRVEKKVTFADKLTKKFSFVDYSDGSYVVGGEFSEAALLTFCELVLKEAGEL